jgi:hypothetical protein
LAPAAAITFGSTTDETHAAIPPHKRQHKRQSDAGPC